MESRYSRQIMLPEIGEAGQEKLRQARVLVVGAGGLGSPILLYLTAAGVGHIGIIDNDTVSESNLQRQILYTEAEVGHSKVDCAVKHLRALNRTTRIEGYPTRLITDNAEAIISQYDLVVDGCDNAATRYIIDEVCARQGKPYVYGSISQFSGQVSVFNYQGSPRYSDLYPRPETLPPPAPEGVMGFLPGIIGSIEAAEAIKIITGYGEPLSRKLLLLDTHTMRQEIVEW